MSEGIEQLSGLITMLQARIDGIEAEVSNVQDALQDIRWPAENDHGFDREVEAFGYQVIDDDDVRISFGYISHPDAATPETDYRKVPDGAVGSGEGGDYVTITLTASKYTCVYVDYEIGTTTTDILAGTASADIDAALNAVDYSADNAKIPLYVFYRDGSNNISLALDCRFNIQIKPIASP